MSRNLNIKNIVILGLIFALLLTAVIWVISIIKVRSTDSEETAVISVDKAVSVAADFNVSLEYLQTILPDYLIYTVGGEYMYQKLDPQIPRCDYDYSLLGQDASGRITYNDPEYAYVLYGIDVSQYQGDIDWPKVAADNVDFAYIRVGFRGYGSGKLVMDEKFSANIRGAKAAGLQVGVYFFSQAISIGEAEEEAQIVLDAIKDYDIDLPVVFDMEEIHNETARTDNLSREEASQITLAFCRKVEKSGYKCMIYGNTKWLAARVDMSLLKDYPIWFAQYYNKPLFPYDFVLWQYSNSGSIEGIPAHVDMNIYFKPQ